MDVCCKIIEKAFSQEHDFIDTAALYEGYYIWSAISTPIFQITKGVRPILKLDLTSFNKFGDMGGLLHPAMPLPSVAGTRKLINDASRLTEEWIWIIVSIIFCGIQSHIHGLNSTFSQIAFEIEPWISNHVQFCMWNYLSMPKTWWWLFSWSLLMGSGASKKIRLSVYF